MNLLINIKAGAKIAPALLIAIYFLFVGLDLFSTYLASPDLRYEGNWLVLLLKLNWGQFILLYFFSALFVTLGLFFGLDFLHTYYKANFQVLKPLVIELLSSIKLFGSYFILACFYSHIINIFHILINNYFVYIYIFQIENLFTKFSDGYISNLWFFKLYISIVPIIMGYSLAFYKVFQIRKLYTIIPEK